MPKILMAVDETKGSRAVLSVYRALVREPETVVLIHVQRSAVRSVMHTMPVGPDRRSSRREETRDERSARIIRFYVQELERSGHRSAVKTLVREGVPSEEILRAAREERVDLIVMGSTGKPVFKGFTIGSTVKQVERGATAPVLAAKNVSCKKSNECCWKERENYAA